MGKKHPGRYERDGISLEDLFSLFDSDATAEAWFASQRWPDGVRCPDCGSDRVSSVKDRRPMPYRCKDCRQHFSVRKGTAMESSPLGYRKWAIAVYLVATHLKGISSMKLHRDLKIRQSSAWFLAHRIREAFDVTVLFDGPVEVDETYMGGKERNKHNSKKLKAGGGAVGKTAVAGAKDRETNRVSAKVVERTDKRTLQGFVRESVIEGAKVYTDDHGSYRGLSGFEHESVKHSVGEYVREQAHTNGIESFWSLLKRGYVGTYHQLSDKHLQRYVDEFSGRHNIRGMGTLDQMDRIARGLVGKRLKYQDLVGG